MGDVTVKIKLSQEQAGKLYMRSIKLEKALSNALKAICLTRDHVGEKALPAENGWEWFEAGKQISELIPKDEWAEQFRLRSMNK